MLILANILILIENNEKFYFDAASNGWHGLQFDSIGWQ
jgi:hypothetical protein